jgi:hypothetical protein
VDLQRRGFGEHAKAEKVIRAEWGRQNEGGLTGDPAGGERDTRAYTDM